MRAGSAFLLSGLTLLTATAVQAEYAATPEVERLGTALADLDLARASCPGLGTSGDAVKIEIDRLGGERLNGDPFLQRAIRQRLMTGQVELRRLSPSEFCGELAAKYGPEGTVLKGLLIRKEP